MEIAGTIVVYRWRNECTRVLACLKGKGEIEHEDVVYAIGKGDVFLLPATVGGCTLYPGSAVNLLEIALP